LSLCILFTLQTKYSCIIRSELHEASEIVDIDRESAIAFLNACYGFPCPKKVEKYLAVVSELRREVDG
jgi:hypothetical protein